MSFSLERYINKLAKRTFADRNCMPNQLGTWTTVFFFSGLDCHAANDILFIISLTVPSSLMSFQWLNNIQTGEGKDNSQNSSSNLTHLHGSQIPHPSPIMQDEISDIGHSCKSDSAENTLHCSSPLFSSLCSLLSCCHTERATKPQAAHGWEDALCIFSKGGISQSSKAITSQREKAMDVSPSMGKCKLSSNKPKERRGLKGITDQRRDKSPSQGKELFFAIKEEKHGSEVSSHGAPIVKKLYFLSWWKEL